MTRKVPIFFFVLFSFFANDTLAQNRSLQEKKISTLISSIEGLEAYGFSGGIMIEKKGDIVYKAGFGYADFENSIKNTAQTRFDLGSVTKHFTAIAILSLEQDGLLDVNDPINKYLNVRDSVKGTIKIRQLLDHTSGFEKDPKYSNKKDFDLVADVSILIDRLELKSSPGATFGYSNFGYCILALIIEKVSGVHYQDFIRERFFVPLEMADTSFYRPEVDHSFSNGYENTGMSMERVDPYGFSDLPLWKGGASGIVTTFKDMNKWFRALFGKKLLNEFEYRDFMTSIGAASQQKAPYALGIRVVKGEKELIFHNGDTKGHEIKMMYFPRSGYRFLFFINNRDRWRNVIEHLIQSFISNKVIPQLPIQESKEDLILPKKKENNGFEIMIKDDGAYLIASEQKSLFELTDLDLSKEEAEKLNDRSGMLAQSILGNDTVRFGKFIDLNKYSAKERLTEIRSSFSNVDYDSFEVMGTAVWRPGVNQTFIKFFNQKDQAVIRFVWHPKKSEFLFYGSGQDYLAVRKLVRTDQSTFYTFSPKDKYYRKIKIGEEIHVIKPESIPMRQ